MKVGCFALVDPFSTFEHQLKRVSGMGFSCADVTDTHSGGLLGKEFGFTATVSLDENPFKIKKLFSKYNLTMSTICAHANLLDPCSPGTYGNNEIIKAVKFASMAGTEHVITTEGEPHTPWSERLSYEQKLAVIADKLVEPMELAGELGVKLLLEPHGPVTGTIKGMKDIMNLLGNNQALGVCFDTGNSWLAGSDPVEYAKAFADKIYHAHWKDMPKDMLEKRGKIFGCGMAIIPLGTGEVDIQGCYGVLKNCPHLKYSTLEIAGDDNQLKSYEYLKKLGAE
jgi:inosose dehydratase